MGKLRLKVAERLSQGGTTFLVLQGRGVRVHQREGLGGGVSGWSLPVGSRTDAPGSASAEKGVCRVASCSTLSEPQFPCVCAVRKRERPSSPDILCSKGLPYY